MSAPGHVPTELRAAGAAAAALLIAGGGAFALWLSIPVCEPDEQKQTNGTTAYDGSCREHFLDAFWKHSREQKTKRGEPGHTKQSGEPVVGFVPELRPSAVVAVGEGAKATDDGDEKRAERNPGSHTSILTPARAVST